MFHVIFYLLVFLGACRTGCLPLSQLLFLRRLLLRCELCRHCEEGRDTKEVWAGVEANESMSVYGLKAEEARDASVAHALHAHALHAHAHATCTCMGMGMVHRPSMLQLRSAAVRLRWDGLDEDAHLRRG